MKLVTRSQLGWPKSAAPSQATTRGVKVHYEGSHVSKDLLEDHDLCIAEWKAIRKSHLANRAENYSDVAYNYAACPHGFLLEGRGIGRRTGANGSAALNTAHYAILGLVGSSGLTEPTDAMLGAIRDGIELLRKHGAGSEIKGHRDGYATACPGGPLYAWVKDGAPRPKSMAIVPKSRESAATVRAQAAKALKSWPFIPEVERARGLPEGLLLAVGSRETNLRNVVGDQGHGHGVWQQDDRWWPNMPDDFDQDVERQALKAADMLADNHKALGSWPYAIAAYNRGVKGVRDALAAGKSPDSITAGGDYAADVLGRLAHLTDATPAPKPTVDLSKLVAAARKDPSARQGHQTYAAGVRVVERALVAEGVLGKTYASDGSFGSVTVAAYAAWQRRLGYSGRDADGIPGRASLDRLGKKHGFTVGA